MFPETASNDKKVLEEKFVECINDEVARFRIIEYAWDKLNEIYNYDLVKKQLVEVYND